MINSRLIEKISKIIKLMIIPKKIIKKEGNKLYCLICIFNDCFLMQHYNLLHHILKNRILTSVNIIAVGSLVFTEFT